MMPSSGDIHDYFGIASYAWPCTAHCNVRIEPFDCSDWCTPLVHACNWTSYWMTYGWQCNGGAQGLRTKWRLQAFRLLRPCP